MDVKLNGESQLIEDWRTVIESVELYVGGQLVDRQDSEFSEDIAIDLLASSYAKSFSASLHGGCLLYTSPSPRDLSTSRMPSSA